jgi:hypothetical protein
MRLPGGASPSARRRWWHHHAVRGARAVRIRRGEHVRLFHEAFEHWGATWRRCRPSCWRRRGGHGCCHGRTGRGSPWTGRRSRCGDGGGGDCGRARTTSAGGARWTGCAPSRRTGAIAGNISRGVLCLARRFVEGVTWQDFCRSIPSGVTRAGRRQRWACDGIDTGNSAMGRSSRFRSRRQGRG